MNFAAAGVLAAMMLLTVSDVFLRYSFSRPIIGTTELTEIMMICVAFLGLAWCAVKRGHLKVDLVMAHFSPRIQAIVDSITLLAVLGLCVFITWRSFLESITVMRLGSTSSLLEVPDYPFYFILTFGFAILCVVMVTNLIEVVAKAVKE
jgi:TRAP-type C4-dicarboxylate transport system permease small subunit